MRIMNSANDGYGRQLLSQFLNQSATCEIIEREDGFIGAGSDPGCYFSEFKQWLRIERRAIKMAKGRVLDIGCGAGRHSLYLQGLGHDVTGIDNSPGAIKVCKLRGLKKCMVRTISDVDKFKPNAFDTVLMLGNNFGLFGSRDGAKQILKKLDRITSPDAQIVAGSLNPYKTKDPDHIRYHKLNKTRGRMPGQIRMRIRFGKTIGGWFDYLFVSPEEMNEILDGTRWRVERFIDPENTLYAAKIRKKS